ncbi:MAG: RNA 2',3'-cyclic phosphodiesterase [Methanosphaera sp.]|uniref:RNA 2',3'-cyclic phosphodiesterase n=1 Tax=Methanosphaera sp. TaxID=2666342 RepID=UPI0025D18E20|nr:RNA 2',3'-cyclic phosphodiesterase [Methanosphaera sp.]MDD6534138.1 RNA 2',3'-cyclic phosphodiesterase [Methanosphaera sp.]
MRAFLAIELNDYVIENILKTQQVLDENSTSRLKHVERENMHLTVKFFGDINERKLKQIKRIINETIESYKPYTMKVAGVGAFANIKHPKTIWTTVKDKEKNTINLIRNLDDKFADIGFKKERSYKPHITISRVKQLNDAQNLSKTLSDMKGNYYGKVDVNKIVLKSSTLTPDGPIYKNEEEFIL